MSVSVPTVYNTTLTNANTEYSRALPSFCRGVKLMARPLGNGDLPDIKLAFISGDSGTTYLTIPGGYRDFTLPENMCAVGVLTLYMQSASAGVVVEILAWT